ncbi:Hairy/enhancer-of-split with YRPW motif protein 2 [Sporothrix curviconia]|uniref:Sugar phosphate phosphatase n=1 Tax=Sporothrix curviconia TaxID=1260050 RepID=A0ABP0CBQ7_9PEZI
MHDAEAASYSTGERTSFAWETARERWPVILTQAIDDVYRSVQECGDDKEKETEGRVIVEKLARLKYDVQHDRPLEPIADDGESDVAAYNAELAQLGPLSWLKAPWLFAECYLFRRMSTYFKLSTHWSRYDPFARQKIRTFRSSRPAVLELAARYGELMQQMDAHKADDFAAEETLFAEMCEICLWGNATDLSLLTNLTYEDIQKLQGAEARRKAEANILVNDLPTAYNILTKARDAAAQRAKTQTPGSSVERRVDIVLDNAGFELYVDLILAGYLLRAGLATVVVLHPKNIPWFVSDVLPSDFAALLNALANPKPFYETPSEEEELQGKPAPAPLTDAERSDLAFLFSEWTQMYANGQVVMRPNIFWTQPGSFGRLPKNAPALFDDLKTSELVIFKGDLNYRKLTSDLDWDATTPFEEAIGPLGPGSGINVLALRTCKADVVVGLPAGKDEELRQAEGGGGDSGARKWAWNGKWAVVSCSQGKEAATSS